MGDVLLLKHHLGFDCEHKLPDNCYVKIEHGCVLCVYQAVVEPWDGLGLPPIGIDFEWRYGDHAWKIGSALYIGSVYAILVANDGEQHYYLRDMQFRPIRTPEQIAIELQVETIKEIAIATGLRAGAGQMEVARAIYNAGYRKFEITDDSDPS